MYGLFTYIWLKFMVNVGKYSIHGSRTQGPWFYRGKLAVSFREGTRKICCWIAPPCLDTSLALRIPNILTIVLISLCQLLAKSPNMGFFGITCYVNLVVEQPIWKNNYTRQIVESIPTPGFLLRKNDEEIFEKKTPPIKVRMFSQFKLKRNPKQNEFGFLDNPPTTNIFLPETRWSQWFCYSKGGICYFFLEGPTFHICFEP